MHWFKQLRVELGWTQQQMGEALGVTNSFICDVEHGKRWLSERKIALLSQKTGRINLDYLQAEARGEFTLPVPKSAAGQCVVLHLMALWETLTERHYENMMVALRGYYEDYR